METNNACIDSKPGTLPVKRLIGFALLGAAVSLAAIYAHLQLAPISEDYTGPLTLLDRTFDLILALALVGAAFCIGRRLSTALKLVFASLAEEFSLSIMLGTGVMGLGVLCLGLVGLLNPLPTAGLITLLVATSHREVVHLVNAISEVARAATATRTRCIVALLFSILTLLMVVRALTPPHAYDEAIYHLSVPKRFVEQGQVYPMYDNAQGNMPLLIHMIYAVCLLAKADIAAKLFSLLLAFTTALALFGFCARFFSRRAGTIALFAFFGAGMVVEVAVTARIDVSLAGMLFVATNAMMVYLETGRRGWLWASAILAGFSLGIKYTAAVWLLLLGVMFLFEGLLAKREAAAVVVRRGFTYMVIAAAVASPWFVKNLVWFDNPVYSFFTGEVAEVDNGNVRYFTAEDERKLDAHLDAARREAPESVSQIEQLLSESASSRIERHPLWFWEYFTEPGAYNVGEDYHNPNYLFLFTPLLLLLDKSRWLMWLAFFSIAFYLFIASTAWTARYLLPIYPALTVLTAITLINLVDRYRLRAPLIRALPALVLVIAVGSVAFVSASQFNAKRGMSFIMGSTSRRNFMKEMFYYPPIDFINRQLPQNALVMMMGAQMCYHLQRDYIGDTSWDSTSWRRLLIRNASLEEVNHTLKRQGITHVLYSPSLFPFSTWIGRKGIPGAAKSTSTVGPDYQIELRNWATFNLYRKKFLEPIFADDMYQIYRIK